MALRSPPYGILVGTACLPAIIAEFAAACQRPPPACFAHDICMSSIPSRDNLLTYRGFRPGRDSARAETALPAIFRGCLSKTQSMSLRFHLLWTGMLTALGFGALAAGAAWLHAVDYVGHLYVQLALNATGGLILGGAAWAFNERVADAANLHTKPVLRLTLAGVLASYAAAWVASPYSELTAGTQSVIAPLLSVILYVAAGILPVI